MSILVAECGINHNGDMAIAKRLIDMAKEGGCEYVKFQKRSIDDVYSPEELAAHRESPWGTTFRAQKEGLELSADEYAEIDAYCKDRGMKWFASPWDPRSVDFLMVFDPPCMKVASASLGNMPLLRSLRDTGKPLIVSTGMCSKDELDAALCVLGPNVSCLMACTSTYPAKPDDMNMRKIETLRSSYPGLRVGFSNHSPGIIFILMAAVMGAEMIEYHITADRSMYGSDQASSIEMPGIIKIRDYLADMKKGMGNGSIGCLEAEKPVRKKLWKSVP